MGLRRWITLGNHALLGRLRDKFVSSRRKQMSKDKTLVTVSTGKASWDRYDEYIQTIAEFSSELGFKLTVVTDDHAQGLMVSQVIRNQEMTTQEELF